MSVRTCALLLILASTACAAWRDAPATVDESRIAKRLHADPDIEVLALRAEEAGRVVLRDRHTGKLTVVADGVRDAVWGQGALFALLDGDQLVRIEGSQRTLLLSDAQPGLALLGDGTVIAVGGAGDNADLWRIDMRGVKRKLAPAPGRDGAPLALDDGRVAFISEREGEPAIFIADAFGRGVERLSKTAPSPVDGIEQLDGALLVRDRDGALWSVGLADGKALRVEASSRTASSEGPWIRPAYITSNRTEAL
jgi:hypothetical protein